VYACTKGPKPWSANQSARVTPTFSDLVAFLVEKWGVTGPCGTFLLCCGCTGYMYVGAVTLTLFYGRCPRRVSGCVNSCWLVLACYVRFYLALAHDAEPLGDTFYRASICERVLLQGGWTKPHGKNKSPHGHVEVMPKSLPLRIRVARLSYHPAITAKYTVRRV
jgi:hypothetical protein